jgi:hypothetical protein
MIVDSLFSFLAADAGIYDRCQSIFPQTIPQNASLPAITYTLNSEERDQLMAGVGLLKTALIDIEAWHTDHRGAHELADAIETLLAGYRGEFGSKTAEHIRMERKFELFESDSGLYRVSQQFLIAYY